MSKSSLSTPAKLLARYLRGKGLANLTHIQALEALSHAGNVDFRVAKAQEAEVLISQTVPPAAGSTDEAEAIVELLFQTLSDWKPDQLRAYGLDALYEKAAAFTNPMGLGASGPRIRADIVEEIVEDIEERARGHQFRVIDAANALELARESANALRLEASEEELSAVAERLY